MNPPKNPQILSCLNIHPANLFRLAYSRNKHVRANTIGVVNVHILNTTQWETGLVLFCPKFAALRLLVETMPNEFRYHLPFKGGAVGRRLVRSLRLEPVVSRLRRALQR
jgi:hypothetical protein